MIRINGFVWEYLPIFEDDAPFDPIGGNSLELIITCVERLSSDVAPFLNSKYIKKLLIK